MCMKKFLNIITVIIFIYVGYMAITNYAETHKNRKTAAEIFTQHIVLDEADKSLTLLCKKLSQSVGGNTKIVAYYSSKFTGDTIGNCQIYTDGSSVIKIKYKNDMETIIHEVAHHVDKNKHDHGRKWYAIFAKIYRVNDYEFPETEYY